MELKSKGKGIINRMSLGLDGTAQQLEGLVSYNNTSLLNQVENKISNLQQQLKEQLELQELLINNPEFVRIFNLLLRRY
jgi:hypothetical protein